VVPTATPLASPTAEEITQWSFEICAINSEFLSQNQQITTDIPEPTDRTLQALKEVNASRQPRVEQIYADAISALNGMTPYPGGEPFRLALLAEFQSALDAMPGFFQAIADATTVEEIDAQYLNRGTVNSAGLLNSAQSVVEMDEAFSDAVAAIPTSCRFFEYDARARVRGIETPDFSVVAFEDGFDDETNFATGPFGSGQQVIADGALTLTFSEVGRHSVRAPGNFHDLRIETRLELGGNAPLAGLTCRGDDLGQYDVFINQLGLVLIYSQPGDNLLGRRAAPDSFDASGGVDLAIECIAGNLDPFTLVVYVNGERIAEVQTEHAAVSEGRAGLSLYALAADTVVTFDDLRVLIPAD
jgi:hypothetical protein